MIIPKNKTFVHGQWKDGTAHERELCRCGTRGIRSVQSAWARPAGKISHPVPTDDPDDRFTNNDTNINKSWDYGHLVTVVVSWLSATVKASSATSNLQCTLYVRKTTLWNFEGGSSRPAIYFFLSWSMHLNNTLSTWEGQNRNRFLWRFERRKTASYFPDVTLILNN